MVHAETTAGPDVAFAVLCEANDIVIRAVFDTAGNLIGFGIYTEKTVMISAEPQVLSLSRSMSIVLALASWLDRSKWRIDKL